jgi:uroporphyrinogen decarboxylase
VKQAALDVLAGSEGEGIVLSVGGGTSPGTPRASILAMIEALNEFNASRVGGNAAPHGPGEPVSHLG